LARFKDITYACWVRHQGLVQYLENSGIALVGVVLELHLAIRLYLYRPVGKVDWHWLAQKTNWGQTMIYLQQSWSVPKFHADADADAADDRITASLRLLEAAW
jgi:hypothetical protein